MWHYSLAPLHPVCVDAERRRPQQLLRRLQKLPPVQQLQVSFELSHLVILTKIDDDNVIAISNYSSYNSNQVRFGTMADELNVCMQWAKRKSGGFNATLCFDIVSLRMRRREVD